MHYFRRTCDMDNINFTVITRTSGRPKFFEECRRSVVTQSVKPYHLVGYDNTDDTYPEGDEVAYLVYAPGRGHNLYFNTLRHYIPRKSPWVIFLDDDDKFMRLDALALIRDAITSENDIILWRVDFGNNRLVPARIGETPEPGNISGLGFCYHSKHWVNWPGYPMGDFFVISQLYKSLNPIWLPDVLTGLQAEPGMGKRMDK